MSTETTYRPDFDSLKSLLLDMAVERGCTSLLELIVERLRGLPDVALARVWLMRPGDICDSCRMRDDCPDRTACLHLVASAGESRTDASADWSRTNGKFRRFPLGVRKVGTIAAEGRGLIVDETGKDDRWIADPEWAEREGIRSFGGQPLIHRGEVLGVLGVFFRVACGLSAEGSDWLRMIADHAAVSIANARAFEEIEQLKQQLEDENAYLREEVREIQAFGDIIGQSSALQNVIRQIELVAPTDAGVLILGESGTGKELVAREIHNRSERGKGPMIKVNCASIPRELYESEFFGHVKGAFTGAVKDRVGRFQLAHRGTLFLDEVGEIPLELQSKLLRVLQEGTFERVGEERTREVEVRIVAATNRDLKIEADAGRFRQDLFYRLNVFPIEVAPLRQRVEDIPPLAEHFLALACKKLRRPTCRLTPADKLQLQGYEWPGNVRELQNVIERSVILSAQGRLRFEFSGTPAATRSAASSPAPDGDGEVISDAEMQRRERDNIMTALTRTEWRIYGPGGAAELLGLKPTTLASRIKKLGLKKPAATP